MAGKPEHSIRPAKMLEEDAALIIIRTADLLVQKVAGLLKPHAFSPTQYNVLRILRGAPGGISAKEIAGRLVTRDPDITRLMDRLEGEFVAALSVGYRPTFGGTQLRVEAFLLDFEGDL